MARRQAGDAGRRDLLLRCLQEKQSALLRPTTATSSRWKRPASARSPSPSTARAIANCRRSSASSTCCRSTGGKAPTRTARSATSAQTTLEPPLGTGPYRIKDFAPGRTIVYERVKDYWGKDLNVSDRHRQFRRAALRIFPRHDGRARSVQGRHGRLAHREQRQELGDRLRLPGRQGQARHPGRISDQQFRHHAGLRLQHPPRQIPGPAGAAARSTTRSISRK